MSARFIFRVLLFAVLAMGMGFAMEARAGDEVRVEANQGQIDAAIRTFSID
jgi:hypothetical protein